METRSLNCSVEMYRKAALGHSLYFLHTIISNPLRPDYLTVNDNTYLYSHGLAMMVESRKHLLPRHNLEPIHAIIGGSKTDIWKPVQLPNNWKGLGEMFTKSSNFDRKLLEIR